MEKSSKYNKDFGNKGEDIASSFIEKNGFEIIKRNYRYQRMGEIDIIAQNGDLIIFIEVKSRKTSSFGGAFYSISKRKRNTLKKIASQFLFSNPLIYSKDKIYRFDMISIDNGRVEWIEDIFR